tara:strand:+ start:340 stop:720 length:381 start_codon:yes stop_codon:yes gene_type:complete
MKPLFVLIFTLLIFIGCNEKKIKFEVVYEGYVYDNSLKKEERILSLTELKALTEKLNIKLIINETCKYAFVSYGQQSSISDFNNIIAIEISDNNRIKINRESPTYSSPPISSPALNTPYQIIKICN